jgi:hypothetical protein
MLAVASLADTAQAGAFSATASVGVLVLSAVYAAAAAWEHRRG